MKKKVVASMLAVVLVGLSFGNPGKVYASEDDSVQITREVNQYLYNANSVGSDIIEMYEEGGWTYNPDENYFVRTVRYKNSPIEIDGKTYRTDSNGSVEINSDDSVIQIESLTGLDEVNINLDNYDDEIVVVENVSVNKVMKTMDTIDVINSEEYDGVFELGQSDGEKPSTGAVVACNRFNGYLGNGRYYSSQTKPQAIKNFFGSDCDWALAVYANCIMDEQPFNANWRYCSLVSSSHYGKCSALAKKVNGKSHSRYFHMHSGYKS